MRKNIFYNNYFIFLILFSLIILYNLELFTLGGDIFSFNEEDVYSIFDYRVNNDLSGWRFNTGLGQSFLSGDPSFHSWSILNLLFNISFINNELFYYLIFCILCTYNSFCIYLFLNFTLKNLKKYQKILISSLFGLASFKSEFFYLTQWMMIASGISLSSIILFKYFKLKKDKYIFFYALNLFIIFHFGGSIAVQQTLIYSLLFYLIFQIYFFKRKINFILLYSFLKISFLSLFIFILSSLWILYPTIYYSLFEYERSSEYFELNFSLDFVQYFKDIFNLLFGNLFNKKNIIFPDKNLTPNYGWYSNLPLIINLFFISLFLKIKKNFWEFFCFFIILFYLSHSTLSSLFPFYGSINTFVLPIYPWAKVHIELFVLQIFLIGLILNNQINNTNLFYKVYRLVLIIFFSLISILILDNLLNMNLISKIFTEMQSIFFINSDFIKTVYLEILKEYFNRFFFVIDIKLFLYFIISIILIYFFSNSKKKILNINFLIVLILISTFFYSKHFAPLNDSVYVWDKDFKGQIDKNDRLILVDEINTYNLNLENINVDKFDDWKNRHPIVIPNYFGYRSPPFNSFSRVTSFNSKHLSETILGEKKNYQNNYRTLQYPKINSLNTSVLNNLSINLIVSKKNLFKNFQENLIDYEMLYESDFIYIYKLKNSLPYIYFPKELKQENINNFISKKINKNFAYLNRKDLNLVKKKYSGNVKIESLKIKNGIINFEYSSDETNFLVISDLYDKKWTAYVDNINTKIYRANLFFKSIEIPKGNHKIILKYDNSDLIFPIYISLFAMLFFVLLYLKKYHNAKNYK